MLNKEKEIKITVDFDNTCALEDFPLVGADVPYAVETLNRFVPNSVKLIYTVINWRTLEETLIKKGIL